MGFFFGADIDTIRPRSPELMEKLLPWVTFAEKYFRSEVRGLERIPEPGALFVGNHSAGALSPDSFLFGAAVYRRYGLSRLPYGLGHEVVIQLPGFRDILLPLGAVRAGHDMAEKLLTSGHNVLVYPGGDIDSCRPFRHRGKVKFGGREGYIRLALNAGVPIVPVVTSGAHSTFLIIDDGQWFAKLIGSDKWLRLKVWPLTLSLPWGLTFGWPPTHFPWRSRILIEVLPPIRFGRYGREAVADAAYVTECAHHVESAMQAALDRLEAERRLLS